MSITLSAAHSHSVPCYVPPIGSKWVAEATQDTFGQDLRAMHPFGVRMRFARNETITSESAGVPLVYKVISGMVRLCKRAPDGRRQIADFMLPGGLFGFMAGVKYGFAAQAVTDVILFAYPQHQIDHLAAAMPSLYNRVNALLAENSLIMRRHLEGLRSRTPNQRVAAFLLRLSERNGSILGDRLDISMGRQDIADHLGLTTETVCRAITELKRIRIVTAPNTNELIINDLNALEAVAGGEASGAA